MNYRRWFALTAATVVLAVSGAMLAVAISGKTDASAALDRARRLHSAQLEVARAEKELGGADLGDAIEAAEGANTIALEVGRATARIVALLDDAQRTVEEMLDASQRGAANAVFAKDQTRVAADILAAISGYQQGADRYSRLTNRSLEKILRALRRTNRSFPPRIPP